MARILLVWELGGGMGHLTRLRQAADVLIDRGHIVYVAVRNVLEASRVFQGTGVDVLPAPILSDRPAYAVRFPRTFGEILHDVGFGSISDLSSLVTAWESIYRLIRPEVIAFDHSPTALLAAGTHSARRVLLGTGFACPRTTAELIDLRPWMGSSERNRRTEEIVLNHVNFVRSQRGLPAIKSLSELFLQVDANLLATFPELDHYGYRPEASYLGTFPSLSGARQIEWPQGGSLRAFAYLKPHSVLDAVVAELTRREIATVLYTGNSQWNVERWNSRFVRVHTSPVDVDTAARQADLAILNGTHATTAEVLLAGRPSIHLPLVLEQLLVANRVTELAAGSIIRATNTESFRDCFGRAMDQALKTAGANVIAQRYRDFDSKAALQKAVTAIDALAG
jgi:hypothetical protein